MAFASSLLAFLAVLAAALVMVGVQQSGVRGAGLVLLLGGLAAFAGASFLVFAPRGYFDQASHRALGAGAAIVALVPVAAMALGALLFVGVPASDASRLDWAVFGIGALLALGALSIAALAFERLAKPHRASLARNAEGAIVRPARHSTGEAVGRGAERGGTDT
jgi:hypothetical protein